MKKRITIISAFVLAVFVAGIVTLAVANPFDDEPVCEKSIPGLSLKLERQLPPGYTAEATDEKGRKVVCE